DRTGAVLAVARSKEEAAALRKTAVTTLGQLAGDAAVAGLSDLLEETPADLQPEVAKALGEIAKLPEGPAAVKNAGTVLRNLVTGAKTPAALRDVAVVALTAGRAGSIWLLDLHAKGGLSAEVAATAGRVLR